MDIMLFLRDQDDHPIYDIDGKQTDCTSFEVGRTATVEEGDGRKRTFVVQKVRIICDDLAHIFLKERSVQ